MLDGILVPGGKNHAIITVRPKLNFECLSQGVDWMKLYRMFLVWCIKADRMHSFLPDEALSSQECEGGRGEF